MKPPPRTRNKPSRCIDTYEAPKRGEKAARAWHVGEQRNLLKALNSLDRTAAGQTDLDYAQLEKCVPNRSASEIQALVERLKRRVVLNAAAQLQRTTQEERSTWKPVEEWTHLAAAATGSLEHTISTAFLQMLIVSSTEPRTLQKWDPPRPLQAKTRTRGREPRPEEVAPTPGSETAAVNRSASGLTARPGWSQPATSAPSGAGASGLPAPPAPSPSPAATPGPSGVSVGPAGRGCVDDDVNFEKIYCYLSTIQKPNEDYKLNPMESAVVLDLLSSLPEELPLLDCNGLHRHLTKVQQCFSAPAKSKTAKQTFKEIKDRHVALARGPGGTALTRPEDMNTMEVPPLNPFMVPLSLLRRQWAAAGNGFGV